MARVVVAERVGRIRRVEGGVRGVVKGAERPHVHEAQIARVPARELRGDVRVERQDLPRVDVAPGLALRC